MSSGGEDGAGAGGGGHHTTGHKQAERRLTSMMLNHKLDKRTTIRYNHAAAETILHSGGGTGGDTGTPRRPQNLHVDQTKINKLAS